MRSEDKKIQEATSRTDINRRHPSGKELEPASSRVDTKSKHVPECESEYMMRQSQKASSSKDKPLRRPQSAPRAPMSNPRTSQDCPRTPQERQMEAAQDFPTFSRGDTISKPDHESDCQKASPSNVGPQQRATDSTSESQPACVQKEWDSQTSGQKIPPFLEKESSTQLLLQECLQRQERELDQLKFRLRQLLESDQLSHNAYAPKEGFRVTAEGIHVEALGSCTDNNQPDMLVEQFHADAATEQRLHSLIYELEALQARSFAPVAQVRSDISAEMRAQTYALGETQAGRPKISGEQCRAEVPSFPLTPDTRDAPSLTGSPGDASRNSADFLNSYKLQGIDPMASVPRLEAFTHEGLRLVGNHVKVKGLRSEGARSDVIEMEYQIRQLRKELAEIRGDRRATELKSRRCSPGRKFRTQNGTTQVKSKKSAASAASDSCHTVRSVRHSAEEKLRSPCVAEVTQLRILDPDLLPRTARHGSPQHSRHGERGCSKQKSGRKQRESAGNQGSAKAGSPPRTPPRTRSPQLRRAASTGSISKRSLPVQASAPQSHVHKRPVRVPTPTPQVSSAVRVTPVQVTPVRVPTGDPRLS